MSGPSSPAVTGSAASQMMDGTTGLAVCLEENKSLLSTGNFSGWDHCRFLETGLKQVALSPPKANSKMKAWSSGLSGM